MCSYWEPVRWGWFLLFQSQSGISELQTQHRNLQKRWPVPAGWSGGTRPGDFSSSHIWRKKKKDRHGSTTEYKNQELQSVPGSTGVSPTGTRDGLKSQVSPSHCLLSKSSQILLLANLKKVLRSCYKYYTSTYLSQRYPKTTAPTITPRKKMVLEVLVRLFLSQTRSHWKKKKRTPVTVNTVRTTNVWPFLIPVTTKHHYYRHCQWFID